MAKTSSIRRTLELIDMLNKGKTLNIKYLSEYYETSERSIYRDIELIKDIFGDNIYKVEGGYKSVTSFVFNNVLDKTNLALFFSLLKISKENELNIEFDNEFEKMIKEYSCVYRFNTRPFEMINNPFLNTIESAIKNKQKIDISYKNRKGNKNEFKSLHPYKIVFLNENFYLVCLSISKDYRTSFLFKLNSIIDISLDKTTFHVDFEFKKFVNNLQTPYGHFYNKYEEYKEVFYVGKQSAHYFKNKKYFPSQKIVKENEDGSIDVEITVNQPNELVEFFLKWVPVITINKESKLFHFAKKSIEKKFAFFN